MAHNIPTVSDYSRAAEVGRAEADCTAATATVAYIVVAADTTADITVTVAAAAADTIADITVSITTAAAATIADIALTTASAAAATIADITVTTSTTSDITVTIATAAAYIPADDPVTAATAAGITVRVSTAAIDTLTYSPAATGPSVDVCFISQQGWGGALTYLLTATAPHGSINLSDITFSDMSFGGLVNITPVKTPKSSTSVPLIELFTGHSGTCIIRRSRNRDYEYDRVDVTDTVSPVQKHNPLPPEQGDKPLHKNEGDKPPQNEGGQPLPQNEGDKPLPQNEGDKPLSQNKGDKPLLKNEGDRPLPQNKRDNPFPQNKGDMSLPQNEGDKPLPQNSGDKPVPQDSRDKPPLPPDGGWGYVCIVAAFLLQCLFGLVVKSFGIIYLLLLDRYNTTATLAAWVGAANLLFFGLGGPLTSMLCKRFTHRSVAIAGCLLKALGFIITGYSPNIFTVYLGFGVFVGVGVGMSSVSAYLILDKYFLTKKGMATSIAASGVGVSMFILPSLMNYFEQEYGFQGTMLLLGGICLNGIICAALFRPVEWPKRSFKDAKAYIASETDLLFGYARKSALKALKDSSEIIVLTSVKNIKGMDGNISSEFGISNALVKCNIGFDNAAICVDEYCNESVKATEAPSSQKDKKIIERDGETSVKEHSRINLQNDHPAADNKVKTEKTDAHITREVDTQIIIHNEAGQAAKTSRWRSCIPLVQDVPAVVGLMMISYFFPICDSCMYSFLPALAIDRGSTINSSKLLISWGGISDMVHRIAFGFIMDCNKIRPYRAHIYCVLALIAAIMTLAIPAYSQHAAYVIGIVVFGGFSGIFFAQRVTITSDLTGAERTPLAFGFVTALNACGYVTGRMIGGVIKDHTGSYDLVFYISGTLPAAGAIIFHLLVLLSGQKHVRH